MDPTWIEPVANTGILLIPKCASSSLKKMRMGAAKSLKRDPVPDRMICFVREPIERLKSAYQFFSQSRSNKFRATWHQFIDAVLAGNPNIHWKPQTRFIERFDNPQVYPFEKVSEVWRMLVGSELAHANPSAYKALDDYRLNELRKHYAEDYQWR